MPVGKNFTVIKIPDDYSLEIGRQNAEVNIPDMSVSEEHGHLKYDSDLDEIVYFDN